VPLILLAWRQAFAVKSGPLRNGSPSMVVIHSTGGPTCDDNGRPVWVPAGALLENIKTIEAHPKLGIHYMIDRDGSVVTSIPESQVAHHVLSYSSRSIGIELVNDGNDLDPYPEPQVSALVRLLRQIVHRYSIGPSGIRRHSDLDKSRMACAPERRRKVDPGSAFPYEEVLRQVFARE
jgi:N-acetylmuramoyl-L-alanine amidase